MLSRFRAGRKQNASIVILSSSMKETTISVQVSDSHLAITQSGASPEARHECSCHPASHGDSMLRGHREERTPGRHCPGAATTRSKDESRKYIPKAQKVGHSQEVWVDGSLLPPKDNLLPSRKSRPL